MSDIKCTCTPVDQWYGPAHDRSCASIVAAEHGRHDGADSEVDRVARLLMAEWERVEHEPVNVSRIATFADMARVVVADNTRLAGEVSGLTTERDYWHSEAQRYVSERDAAVRERDEARSRASTMERVLRDMFDDITDKSIVNGRRYVEGRKKDAGL